jgi:putative ABC transport system ATP-binding protein
MIAPAPPRDTPVVRIHGLNHCFVTGNVSQKALIDIRIDIAPGQLVILTGPSGCGKTTLLTLIGGLRSVQKGGSLEVLTRELHALDNKGLIAARRDIGFIFQAHNLLEALSAADNVRLALELKSYTAEGLRAHAAGLLGILPRFALTEESLAGLAEAGVSAGVLSRLEALQGQALFEAEAPEVLEAAGVTDLLAAAVKEGSLAKADADQFPSTLLRHARPVKGGGASLVEAGAGRKEAIGRALAAGLLAYLGLARHAYKKPNELSGGQKQRVAIARALCNHPRLILADEPTAALDKESSGIVIDLLQKLARNGSTILVVTHDNRIMDKGDRVVTMKDGRIVSDIMVDETVRICVFLQQIPLFSALTPGDLVEVAEKMSREAYPTGTPIVRQNDMGDKFYLIKDGKVDVIKEEQATSRVVATLDRGQFFGEVALQENCPRTATVVAKEPVEVYTLQKDDFLNARAKFPTMRDELIKVFANRSRES